MGHGSKGAIKDRSNSASPGIDIQGGDTVSAIIWQRDLGGDQGDAQFPVRFHHWVARRMTGMTAKRGAGGEWGYLSLVEAIESVGIHPIRVYIQRRQTPIADRVACRPVYTLCMKAELIPGTSRLV